MADSNSGDATMFLTVGVSASRSYTAECFMRHRQFHVLGECPLCGELRSDPPGHYPCAVNGFPLSPNPGHIPESL